jgi:hypothetical protein
MMSEKAMSLVLARESGATLAEVGRRHGVSHQRVASVMRHATEFVDKVEMDLLVARKEDSLCAFVIPFGPDYSLAQQVADWLLRRLRARDLDLKVSTRRTPDGLLLVIEDVTPWAPWTKQKEEQ